MMKKKKKLLVYNIKNWRFENHIDHVSSIMFILLLNEIRVQVLKKLDNFLKKIDFFFILN